MKKTLISSVILTFFLPGVFQLFAITSEKPVLFPLPGEIRTFDGVFTIDDSVVILIPQNAGKNDEFLAQLISSEFTDKYEHPILIKRNNNPGKNNRFILISDVSSPLVKDYCERTGQIADLKGLGEEGYILSVEKDRIIVASITKKGALFGLESLRQIIRYENGKLFVPLVIIKDSPKFPFRGIKLYLPGRENITFFKRFIRDFAALYKYNTIILELNANMRLEKHPELNIGAVQFERHLTFSRLDRPPGIHMEYQNSSHQDNADGGILEKEEVADLVSYMRKFNFEVIPELPSLTHAYYLLWGHRELAENIAQPYPDTYCPLKPESYNLYFDVLDEYLDVIRPSIVHVGHDEWRMEKDLCELCKGRDYGELYAADITKIHDHLSKKGIRTAIWGDHLLESVTEKEFQTWKSSSGYQYRIPGALRPEQVLKLIPKDILIFNWFWDEPSNDQQISDFGFEQVYGNFRADISGWKERGSIRGLLGGAPSSWAATTEKNFGKDQLTDFLGAANLLWSGMYIPPEKLAFIVESLVGDVYYRFRGKKLPSETDCSIATMDLSVPGHNSKIRINSDVSSIIFTHACENEGSNRKAYSIIHNFDETAELIGWYEIVYEDGFTETIPVRYGLNILDKGWRQRIEKNIPPKAKDGQNQYAYQARAVDLKDENGGSVTWFSYEWLNPRPGIAVKEINLKQIKNGNSILLWGVAITESIKSGAAIGKDERSQTKDNYHPKYWLEGIYEHGEGESKKSIGEVETAVENAKLKGWDGVYFWGADRKGTKMNYYFKSPFLEKQEWASFKYDGLSPLVDAAHRHGLDVIINLEGVNPYHWEKNNWTPKNIKEVAGDLAADSVDGVFEECFEVKPEVFKSLAHSLTSRGIRYISGTDPMLFRESNFTTLWPETSIVNIYNYYLKRDKIFNIATLAEHGSLGYGWAKYWGKPTSLISPANRNWGIATDYSPAVIPYLCMIRALQFRLDNFMIWGGLGRFDPVANRQWINEYISKQEKERPLMDIVVLLDSGTDNQLWNRYFNSGDAITSGAFNAGYNVIVSDKVVPADAYYIYAKGGDNDVLPPEVIDLFSSDKPVFMQCGSSIPSGVSISREWMRVLEKCGIDGTKTFGFGGEEKPQTDTSLPPNQESDLPYTGYYNDVYLRFTGADIQRGVDLRAGTVIPAEAIKGTVYCTPNKTYGKGPFIAGRNKKYLVTATTLNWEVAYPISDLLAGCGIHPSSNVWGIAGKNVTALLAIETTELQIKIPHLEDGSEIHVVVWDSKKNKKSENTIIYKAPFRKMLMEYDFILIDRVK